MQYILDFDANVLRHLDLGDIGFIEENTHIHVCATQTVIAGRGAIDYTANLEH
jgi:hypothetical protein